MEPVTIQLRKENILYLNIKKTYACYLQNAQVKAALL